MATVEREILKSPQKAYLSEEFLRQLTRSIDLIVDVMAALEDLARQSEKTQKTVTGDTTLTESDYVVLVDATSGAVTITLPDADAVNSGRSFIIMKIDSSSNNVTISGDANINGSASLVLSSQYDVNEILSNQTQWYITA